MGHSYSFMPVCAAVKVRQRPRCWFGSCQTMVSSCPPADVLDVPRVPANPCTASPCLALYIAQAGWNRTSKLRPPGASLSSQYRSVSDLKKAETCLRSATALVSQSTPTDDMACGKASQPHPRGIPPPPMPVAFFAQPCRWSGHRASP